MKKILLASLALFAMSGCSKQPAEQIPTGESVSLMLIPTAESVDALTRAAVLGTQFMHGNQVGFSILKANSQDPHLTGYSNIMARGVSSVSVNSAANNWFYYVNGSYMGPTLGGSTLYGNIDVFGYYPYDVAMTNIEAVPFSIGTTTGVTTATEAEATKDYMWATPKSDVDITNAANIPITMNFNHLMTCLEFELKVKFYGPEITVESIKFEISGNGREFTTEGTYNAKTGAITSSNTSNEITVAYSSKTIKNGDRDNQIPVYMQIIMPELKYTNTGDDATIKASFTFETNPLYPDDEPLEPAVYTFALSSVTDGATPIATRTGLLAGKRYQVKAVVENYTKFSGSPIVQTEGFTNVDIGYDNHIGI